MIYNKGSQINSNSMYSFGQLKNLLKKLQTYNRSMGIISKIGQSKSVLDQKEIKNQPIEFYLKIMHFVMIEYSPQLYKSILNLVPNIKTLTDQKFVQSSFNISRKMMNINPKITAEQFLQQGKWVEKKLEFIVELCENIYNWDNSNRNKSIKQTRQTNQLKNYIYQPQNNNSQEEEDQLEQREITVQPTVFDQPPINTSFGRKVIQQKMGPSLKEEFRLKDKETVNICKPNIFPKNLKTDFIEDVDENQQNEFIKTIIPNKKQSQREIHEKHSQNPMTSKPIPSNTQQQSTQYVTKQEFNEALEMLSSINSTVNDLVSKFNSFQTNVTSWFNNTNARVVMLEENVKMIKSNL